jgi:hypothetical protein
MDALKRRISERLEAGRPCYVFEHALERVWPQSGKQARDRVNAIKAFADANNWKMTPLEPGVGVVFERRKSP